MRLRPAEILVDDELKSPAAEFATELHAICGTAVTRRPLHEFSDYQAERSLLDHFGVSTLAGFGFNPCWDRVRLARCIGLSILCWNAKWH